MKELTIEEKAQKYDEAIKKAKSLYKVSESMSGCNVIIETLFPELKESEDEKIRKDIISYLKSSTAISPKAWIAWLEKQGEQKTTIEMKSAEESLGIDSDTYNKIVDECVYGEQKPAKGTKGKDREIPFSEQDWSEEDEKKLNRIYTLLAEAANKHAFSTTCRLIGDKECVELQDFLKSIRPQKQWKPSDEQMEALDNFIYAKYPNTEKYGAAVKSLYQDLKKLKG